MNEMFVPITLTSAFAAASYALAIPQSEAVSIQPSAFGDFQVEFNASITFTPTPTSTMPSFWGSSTTPTSWTLSTTITAVSSEADPVSTDTTCASITTFQAAPAYSSVGQVTTSPTVVVPTISYWGSSTTPTSWTLSSTISEVESLSQGPTSTSLASSSAPLENGTTAPSDTTPVATSAASPAEQTSITSTSCTEGESEATANSVLFSAGEASAPLEYGNIKFTYTTPIPDTSDVSVAPVEVSSTSCIVTITATRSASATDVLVNPVDATSNSPPSPSGPPNFFNGGNSTASHGPIGTATGTGIIAPTGLLPTGTGVAPTSYILVSTTMAKQVSAIGSAAETSNTFTPTTVAKPAWPTHYESPPFNPEGGRRRQRLRGSD